MSTSLGLTVVLYSLLVALACAVTGLAARTRPVALSASLVVLQVAAMGQAVLDAAGLAHDQSGPLPATHLGYLLTSVAILPVAAGASRCEPGRWATLVFAVGCLLLAVVCVRLRQTLPLADA